MGGANVYSEKFGDEKASMSWVDRKRVANFKEINTGAAEDA